MDSSILVGRVIASAPIRQDYKQVLYKIKKRYNEIFIPQTVLGESLAKILEKTKDKDNDVKDFMNVINELIDIKSQAPPLSRDILRMAIEIQDEDEQNIGYCDAILVSHALCSQCDCAVYMIDKAVHHSHKIQTAIEACEYNVKLLESVN